jgi:replicative DNA helicase
MEAFDRHLDENVLVVDVIRPQVLRMRVGAVGYFASVARVDLKKARGGFLTEEERHRQLSAAEEIWQLPLFIDDSHANTRAAICAALRRLTVANPIGLVIVVHIQLTNTLSRSMNRHQELTEVSHAMEHLARKAHRTVMLLSQLNRDCERERRAPHLSDLKETVSLEEDTDVVVFVHRPERYNRDDPSLRGIAQFIVAKQRNGPTGQLDMTFQHAFQRFEQASSVQDRCP